MHSIPFLAVNAGHGEIDSLAGLQNGIQITIRSLNKVTIDGDVATIQGGANNLNITSTLWNAKKQTGMPSFPRNQSCCANGFRLP
jgi:hypothetical protein